MPANPLTKSIEESLHPQHIALIYLGGTFGCVGEPLAPLVATDFLKKLDQLISQHALAEWTCFAGSQIKDSSQLQAADWIELVEQIGQLFQQGFRQFLIIHGTDTLAYSSAFLSEVFNGYPLKIVVTGSQFPLLDRAGYELHPQSDALPNLLHAIDLFSNIDDGCYVAFANEYWPAATVQKVHTRHLQAFSGQPNALKTKISNQFPTLDLTFLLSQLAYLKQLNIAIYHPLPVALAQQAAQLKQLLQTPQLDALILLGFGTGNMAHSKDIADLLDTANAKGILLVVGSQVPFGGVDDRYAAGHWLNVHHVLSVQQLPLAATYARLAWLCCQSPSFSVRRQLWLEAME